MIALEADPPGFAEPSLDVFFALDGASPAFVLELLTALRRAGLASDTDYAGRSLKGQLTQAARLGARTLAIVRADDATVRRAGEHDVVVPLADLLDTLSR